MNKAEEIELKVLEINTEKLINDLEEFGAKKKLDALTEIWTFDIIKNNSINYEKLSPNFLETIKVVEELTWHGKSLREQNYHLRARKQGENYEFTLKFAKSRHNNVKKEIELNSKLTKDEWNNICNLINSAGLTIIAHQEKKRISYHIEDNYNPAHFDIDTWPSIPTYLEIEADSVEIINYWIDKLNLKNNKTSTLSGQRFFDLYNINFYSELLFK
jgi:adenylate cyclase class IV